MAATGPWLRYDFLLVPLLLVAVLPVLRIRRREEAVWLLLALVLGFGIAVQIGMWSTGISEGYVIGGVVPHSDAREYVAGALRLLQDGHLGDWASRRPIFPSFLALLLWFSGQHLAPALGVFLILNVVAIVVATRAVQLTHAGTVAGVVLAGLVLFYRRYVGVALSENVGLFLGCLGFTLLWLAASKAWRSSFYAGLFLLALGLNARAGAFFVLPTLVVWGAWRFRSSRAVSTAVLVNGVLAVVLAFSLNLHLLHAAGHPAMGLSNFYYGLYGLLHGGSWDLVLDHHPDLRLLSETERTAAVTRLALRDLMQGPGLLATGAARAYGTFFFHPVDSAFSFIRITGPGANDLAVAYGADGVRGAMRAVGAQPLLHLNQLVLAGLMVVLNLLALLGLVHLRRFSATGAYPMVLAAWLGILLSVPFAPPWDASMMRGYAVTVPFMIALPALGLASLGREGELPREMRERSARVLGRVALALGLGTAFAVLAAPAVGGRGAVRGAGGGAVVADTTCPEGTTLRRLRFVPVDAALRLVVTPSPTSEWTGRELDIARFREGLRLLSRRNRGLQADLAALTDGTVIASAYDLDRQVAPMLAVRGDLWSASGKVQRLCVDASKTPLHRAAEPGASLPES